MLEYKKFKDAAAQLSQREIEQSNLFSRLPEETDAAPERPLGDVSVFDLINAFNGVLKRIAAKSEDLREIFEENYTVSDKIDLIMKITAGGVSLRFTELFANAASRTEIVVTFLALLDNPAEAAHTRQKIHSGKSSSRAGEARIRALIGI